MDGRLIVLPSSEHARRVAGVGGRWVCGTTTVEGKAHITWYAREVSVCIDIHFTTPPTRPRGGRGGGGGGGGHPGGSQEETRTVVLSAVIYGVGLFLFFVYISS